MALVLKIDPFLPRYVGEDELPMVTRRNRDETLAKPSCQGSARLERSF